MTKASETARLKAQYDKDVKAARAEYNTLAQRISRSRVSFSVKRAQLQDLQKNYASKLNALKLKLAADIAALPDDPSPVSASVPPTNVPTTANAKKCALLVGINYRNTAYQLYGCINDVYNMEKYLRTKKGFTHVSILTDDTVQKPTRSVILSSLQSLVASANSGDTLLFQYSGHGTQTPDKNGDEADGLDEQIVPLDFIPITDDEIRAVLAKVPVGVNIMVLLDSCHSGSCVDLKYLYMDGTTPVSTQNSFQDLAAKVVLVSGCKDSQTSADAYIGGVSQGAMTWAFLQSVNTASTWRELLIAMRKSLSAGGYTQVPQLSAGSPLDIDSAIIL